MQWLSEIDVEEYAASLEELGIKKVHHLKEIVASQGDQHETFRYLLIHEKQNILLQRIKTIL